MQIMCGFIGCGVESIQSFTECSRPDGIVLINIHSHEMIVRKAVGILRIMTIMYELSRAGVEAIQPCAPGGNPNVSELVFRECTNSIRSETHRITRVISIEAELS